MSKSKTLKITCDDVTTREAMSDYFRIYARDLSRYIKAYLQRLGETADPAIIVSSNGTTVSIDAIAQDKGNVLYMIDGDLKLTPYSKVATNTVYALVENGVIVQYIRRGSSESDDSINVFPDLNNAVDNWEKVSVQDVDGLVEDALAEQAEMVANK